MIALGHAIQNIIKKQAALPEDDQTDKIMFVVITDGEENSSREFTKAQIKQLIEDQTKLGWRFDFLSADMNAIADAQSIGFNHQNVSAFAPSSIGYATAYNLTSNSVRNYRTKGTKFITDKDVN